MDWQNLGGQNLANAITKDIAGFNKFREENPSWRPAKGNEIGSACFEDGVYLCGANLSELNMRQANLYKADLRGADLSGTNLVQANVVGVLIDEHQVPEFLKTLGVRVGLLL